MNFAFKFIKKSDKENILRLGTISFAIGIGFLILMVLVSGVNSIFNGNVVRNSWTRDIGQVTYEQNRDGKKTPNSKSLLVQRSTDFYKDEAIDIFYIYPVSENSIEINGLKNPKAGQYYVSPALNKIIKENPEFDIGSRYGNEKIDTIPDSMLNSPDSLVVIQGVDKKTAENNNFGVLNKITNDNSPRAIYSVIQLVAISMGAFILLTPIILFITVASKIGSVQREKRYSTLRLVGATRRQVTSMIAFESLFSALIGIAIATLVFILIHPILMNITWNGAHFWAEDFQPTKFQYIFTVALILLFVFTANWWGTRKVHFSPLNTSRATNISKRPKVWRVLPILPGIVIFIWLMQPSTISYIKNHPEDGSVFYFSIFGVLSLMVGLLFIGPWLGYICSKIVAKTTKSPITLLISSRIKSHSVGVFRSVSGVVLALFAGTFFVTSVNGVENYYNKNSAPLTGQQFNKLYNNAVFVNGDGNNGAVSNIKSKPYIEDYYKAKNLAGAYTIIDCSEVKKFSDINYPKNKKLAAINFYDRSDKVFGDNEKEIKNQLNDESIDISSNNEYNYLFKLKNSEDIDKFRTDVIKTNGSLDIPYIKLGEYAKKSFIRDPIINELKTATYFGMIITLIVAILSLIVSTIGGLLERQKSLYSLRLSGLTVLQLRKSVLIESIIPLFSVSIIACALGFWASSGFVAAATTVIKPAFSMNILYILLLAIVLSMCFIWFIGSNVDRLTKPEANQSE